MDRKEFLKERFKAAVSSAVKVISEKFDLEVKFGNNINPKKDSLNLPEVTSLRNLQDFTNNQSALINIKPISCVAADINTDGIIDILDVVSMVNFVLGNNDEIQCADYNEDGNIDILDIVNIVSLILGN